MSSVLTIGGARFMGRFTVGRFLERGDDLTLFTRGNTPLPFPDEAVDHIQGDRQDEDRLAEAAAQVDPDIVLDFAAYYPADVRTATDLFADVDSYIYVSSTSAFDRSEEFLVREDETPLTEYDPPGDDDETRSYAARKAEGDRIVAAAGARGVNAISVRPTAMYGPYDPTERQNYWIDRVQRFNRVVVPGNGRMPLSVGYAEDVPDAIEILIDQGEAGESYNIATRDVCVIDEFIEHVANALGESVSVVHATRKDLAAVDVGHSDFSYCRRNPYITSSEKLGSLGWETTPFETGVARAVADHLDRDPDGTQHGPSREIEERLLDLAGDPLHIDGT